MDSQLIWRNFFYKFREVSSFLSQWEEENCEEMKTIDFYDTFNGAIARDLGFLFANGNEMEVTRARREQKWRWMKYFFFIPLVLIALYTLNLTF